jgi:predicted nucleic acid-binding protein
MNAEYFIDTNILLYAVSRDPNESAKRQRAREVMMEGSIGFSTQVFCEFYVNATGKIRPGLTHQQAMDILQPLSEMAVLPVTLPLMWRAMSCSEEWKISLWDSCILCAAADLKVRIVWSEDLNHGQEFGGVCVKNPFRQ